MASSVKFTNTSGQAFFVEKGQPNNLLSDTPEVFDNEYDDHAKLGLIDIAGMLFENGDIRNKPIVYFRHTDIAKNKYRFGNLLNLGEGFLSKQNGVYHENEVATPETPIDPYRMVSTDPVIYEFGSTEKHFDCRFTEKSVNIEEGDFLKIKAVPWSYATYDHQSIYKHASYVSQPATFMGSYDGKPVLGLGQYDRMCFSKTNEGLDGVPLGYISLSCMGIREDGRKEQCFVSASFGNAIGKTIAEYFCEGMAPIITDTVEIEADWVHLPYVDDGTCVFKDATFHFCDKHVHFNGLWGSKGFLAKPRLEKHGQSHVFGTWYEGSTPYKHRLFYTLVENMEVYDSKLKAAGFDVLD